MGTVKNKKVTKKRGVEIELPLVQTKIYQPNKITNARYNGLTLIKTKVLYAIFKGLQPGAKKSMNDKHGQQLELFDQSERGDIIIPIVLSEITTSRHYDRVIEAIKDFMKVSIEIPGEKEAYTVWANLIPRVEAPIKINQKSVVNIHLMKDVAETFLKFKTNSQGKVIEYTQYIYEIVMQAKSQYTSVLYPLISSWKNKGGFYITLEEFRKKIGLREDQYKNFSHLKTYVLLPVQKDLERKADCWFNAKAVDFVVKKGNKVVGLNFKVIVPELEEDLQVKYQSIKNILVTHHKFSAKQLESLRPIFEARVPFEALTEKMMELSPYVKERAADGRIRHEQQYIIDALITEFSIYL